MAAKLILVPEALQDIRDAYGWYEERRMGLGEESLSCVDACLENIRRVPESHQMIHRMYRRGLVRRFPYAVIYESDGTTITIYAVFHHSRNPQKWKERSSI